MVGGQIFRAWAVGSVVSLWAWGAAAQVGFDSNTFEPANGPEGLQVEHGRVLRATQPFVGAVLQLDDDPIQWPSPDPAGEDIRIERLMLFHLSAAFGLFDYAQLGVHVPLVMDTGIIGGSGGAGDVRILPKGAYRFRAADREMGVGLTLGFSLPSGNDFNFSGQGVAGFAPRASFDTTLWKLTVAANWGFYFRSSTEVAGLTRGSEMYFAASALYPFLRAAGELAAILEVVGSTGLNDFFGKYSTPVDLALGLRYHFSAGFIASSSLGIGLTPAMGAPDVRFIASLGWAGDPFAGRARDQLGSDVVADSDHDGFLDADDQCVEQPEDFDGWQDDDGCPEADNDDDGFDDLSDKCPNEAETFDGVEDDDGCPDVDTDGDTVPDYRDRCLKKKEDLDGFKDNDGCPDRDNDRDGLRDKKDNCPNLAETKNQLEDEDGCPDFFELNRDKITFKRYIRFVWKAPEVDPGDFDILEELYKAIKAHPEWERIRVEVHAFGGGKNAEQKRITQGRADQIALFLTASGIKKDRIIAVGKGNEETLAPPTTPQNKKKNQRVEVHIIKRKAQ